MPLTLALLPDLFAVCRLQPESPLPDWVAGAFFSVTRTADELSMVCLQTLVPAGVQAERDWRCLKVLGPLDFSLVGVLASLSTALAEARVSLFAVSTFDTDYLLVKSAALEPAVEALRRAGHLINHQPESL